jgi:hypothetical protein
MQTAANCSAVQKTQPNPSALQAAIGVVVLAMMVNGLPS